MTNAQMTVIADKVLELVQQGRWKEAELLLSIDVMDHLNERIERVPLFERLESLAASL